MHSVFEAFGKVQPNLLKHGNRSRPTAVNIITPPGPGISGDIYYRNCLGANGSVVTNEWLETNIRSQGPLGNA